MSDNTLPESVKQQVIIAAATVAGPTATQDEVSNHIARIAGFLDPSSPVQYAFTQIEKQAEKTDANKVLIGTVLGMGKETLASGEGRNPSNRGIVILRTKVHEEYAIEGKELLRTEIANGEGSTGSEHLNALKVLVGHKVRVSFAVEVMANKKKVRVIRGFTDLGADPDYDFNNPDFHPAFYSDHIKAAQVKRVERFYPPIPVAAGV